MLLKTQLQGLESWLTVGKRKYLKIVQYFFENFSVIVVKKHIDVQKYYNYKIEIQNFVWMDSFELQDLIFALG